VNDARERTRVGHGDHPGHHAQYIISRTGVDDVDGPPRRLSFLRLYPHDATGITLFNATFVPPPSTSSTKFCFRVTAANGVEIAACVVDGGGRIVDGRGSPGGMVGFLQLFLSRAVGRRPFRGVVDGGHVVG